MKNSLYHFLNDEVKLFSNIKMILMKSIKVLKTDSTITGSSLIMFIVCLFELCLKNLQKKSYFLYEIIFWTKVLIKNCDIN